MADVSPFVSVVGTLACSSIPLSGLSSHEEEPESFLINVFWMVCSFPFYTNTIPQLNNQEKSGGRPMKDVAFF